MTASIRLAQAADCTAVVACVRAAYAPYVSRIGREPAPMNADYGALIAQRAAYVLELDAHGGICAVLVLQLGSRAMFIENVAVHPDYQRRGLGRRLMAFAEEQARLAAVDEMQLYTNEAMRENIALYQSLGYEETERRDQDGFRRVFMRKCLTPSPTEFHL